MKLSHIIAAVILPVLALLLILTYWYSCDCQKELSLSREEHQMLARQARENQEGIAYQVSR